MKPFAMLLALALLAACTPESPGSELTPADLDAACSDDPSANAPGASLLCNE